VFETVIQCVGFAFGIITGDVSVDIAFFVFRVSDLKMQIVFAVMSTEVYVCMYVCMYTCMYVYMYVCVRACMHACMHAV
jgi:hypothetical protein